MTLRMFAAVAAVGLALIFATKAAATTYTITVPGTVTSISGQGIIQVGDPVLLQTTFDDSFAVVWGNTGYIVGGSNYYKNFCCTVNLPTSGPLNWSISLDGYTYTSHNCNGCVAQPWYTTNGFADGYYGAAIIFNSNGVYGVENLHQQTFLGEPDLFSGKIIGGADGTFAALPFDNTFTIDPSDWPSANQQSGSGVWDFSKATVSILGAPVPEPSTWAMMIAGFGLIGLGLRRRRSQVAVAI